MIVISSIVLHSTLVCCQNLDIIKVYLVSSCHLDVGFANSAVDIVNEYFDKYFPEAIRNAIELREIFGDVGLVFTTHSFLVYLYLNCHDFPDLELHCPTDSEVKAFSDAVLRGDIVWHAFPFNAQMEFYDESLAEFGFMLTHMLDKKFGLPPKITMSQRDVPGITRSILPILERNGIKAITVGVNTASMPPDVPNVFLWKDPISGSEVIAMWHPHGYGGSVLPGPSSTVVVPGLQEALTFAIRGDNSGPPGLLEIARNFAALRLEYPDADIIPSGYDAFVNKLLEVKSQLPVYTGEIGDTWIYGVASDPWKTSLTREMMRLRSSCIASGACSVDSPSMVMFSTQLLKNGEHTWGKDVKKFLHDTSNWKNNEFRRYINESNFKDIANSWVEQRNWGFDLNLLESDSPLRASIVKSMKEMKFDGSVSTKGYTQSTDIEKILSCGGLKMKFSSRNGAIEYFEDTRTQPSKVYSDGSHPLAQFKYQTYTGEDYITYFDEYVYDFFETYIFLDLGKPGLPKTKKFDLSPFPKSLWFKEDSKKCDYLLSAEFDPSSNVTTDYGAPQQVWTHVALPKTTALGAPIELNITVYIVNKTSTRIPESLSLYFNPKGVDPTLMTVSKLGEYIGVLDVIKNGSKHLHASDEGVAYGKTGVKFEALDTSVVCIGYPTPFPTPVEQPDVTEGFAFNIYNNIWGTNYIMWYPYLAEDASSKYRFKVTIP